MQLCVVLLELDLLPILISALLSIFHELFLYLTHFMVIDGFHLLFCLKVLLSQLLY